MTKYLLAFVMLLALNQTHAGVGGYAGGGGSGKLNFVLPKHLDQNDSWELIKGNAYVETKSPAVTFVAGQVTMMVPVLDVCLEGKLLRSAEPQDLWVNDKATKPRVVGQDYLYSATSVKANINKEKARRQQGEVWVSYLKKYEIPVVKRASNIRQADVVLFNKAYEIEACE